MRERSLESPDSSEECERRERCKKVEQSDEEEEGHFLILILPKVPIPSWFYDCSTVPSAITNTMIKKFWINNWSPAG